MPAPKLENVDDVYRLTPMQELMLLHSLATPHSTVLQNQFCYRIDGELQAEHFRQAWQLVIARHPALRSAFAWEGLPHPVQLVRSRVELPLKTVDLRGTPEKRQGSALEDLQRQDLEQSFELRRAPLTRLTLVQLESNRSALIWNTHHLVIDRWSLAPLWTDLAAAYEALTAGQEPRLSRPGVFRDYVAWVERQDRSAAESYWRAALRGFRQTSPASQPASAPPSPQRARLQLDARSTERLAVLLASARISLAVALQAAVTLWLSRKSGREDIAFGQTASGRPADLPQVETIVGCFISNLPVRIRLDDSLRLHDWLQQLQVAQGRRNRFEYLPHTEIRRWSEAPPEADLFDLLLVVNTDGGEAPQLADLNIRLESASLAGVYPLTLAAGKTGDGLGLQLACDAARLRSSSPAEVVEEIGAILGEMSEGGDRAVGDLGAPLRRWPLLDGVRSPAQQRRSASPADSSATAVLLDIWRQVLGRERVGLDEDFFALGGTSVQAATMFMQIEVRFGRSLPLSTLLRAGTVRRLLDVLGQDVDDPTRLLVKMQAKGDGPQVFAVPGIGGNIIGLSALAQSLGNKQPFYGLQCRGLDGSEQPRTDIREIAEDFVREVLREARPPFVVLGICWGAAVALEMAQRLAAHGNPPALLAMLDPAYLGEPTARQRGFQNSKLRFLFKRLKSYVEDFRRARGRQKLRLIATKATRLGSVLRNRNISSQTQVELTQFRVTEANRQAILHYRPEPYNGDSILFFSSERSGERGAAERSEWLRWTPSGTKIVYVPGFDSGDAISPQNAPSFATALQVELDEVRRRFSLALTSS